MDDFIEAPRELVENNQEFIICVDIMLINQQALFTTVDKYIRFWWFVPLANITKEECYRDLYVIIRYNNKPGFTFKRIECDGEFKSNMDEVRNDMGMETNYYNPDNHVPEAERNNRVINYRFRIAYYPLPYKNIPRIMICHLVMNVTQNLNIFPTKRGVLSHYSPHMIVSQSNWGYNKHWHAEFGAYVNSSQVNDPKNTDLPRTLDGIYLCPAPNFQGRHHIMDLWIGQFNTIPKLV